MAYRRYRKRGVRPRRKTRVARRMTRRMPRRIRRNRVSSQIHYFRKQFIPPAQSGGVNQGKVFNLGGGQILSYFFNWNQIPSISEYTSLFDEIKIKKVKWIFEPYYQPSNTGNVGPTQNECRVIWDNDGLSPSVTTENGFLEYSNCKSHNMGYVFSTTLYPKVKSEVYNGSYKMVKPGFMDLQAASPDFLGVYVYVPDTGIENMWLFKVRCDVIFACRKSI